MSDTSNLKRMINGGRVHDALALCENRGSAPSADCLILHARAARLAGHYDRTLELLAELTGYSDLEAEHIWQRDFEQACLLAQRGDFTRARALYTDLLARKPAHPRCLANLYRIALHVCDLETQASLRSALQAQSGDLTRPEDLAAAEAVYTFEQCDDAAKNLAVNRLRAQRLDAVTVTTSPSRRPSRRPDRDKIRIGYLGEPFRNHARAHLLTGVLEHHDRDHFEVMAYCTGRNDKSAMRHRFEAAVDQFYDLEGITDQALADRLHGDALDILIATDGWNHMNRMAVLAGRPASVQISYLGHPSSCGADFIDYMIVDGVIAPVGDEAQFSEQLIRLPDTYQATDDRQPQPASADRADLRQRNGLPVDKLVFASLNQPYKLNRQTLSLWFEILQAVPDSVLWVLDGHPAARQNLMRYASAGGINPERLVFASFAAKPEHITRLTAADIALDPLIYNGHTTTMDALWAGVPVISFYGSHMASRVAASLLRAADMPELVTSFTGDYRDLAIDLARDPARQQTLRERLVAGRDRNSLFDTAGRTRALEAAYKILVK